ncbi:MAG: hypothetical protein ACYSUI_14920 [Planctomycetota bacterium]|jgi:hypothetical protein
MHLRLCTLGVLVAAGHVSADVVSYEATSFPGPEWDRGRDCTPERWIEEGWLYQHLAPGECWAPPAGDREWYTRLIPEFDGVATFFVEWRLEADGDRSEITWGAPSALAAGSLGPVAYTFFIARDQAKLNRDNTLPIIYVDIEAGVPHTHRLELYGPDLYVWYIDGQVADSGVPEGSYPSNTPRITWGAKSAFLEATVKWDYVRYGTIPQPASGDYDSNGNVDLDDLYYFQECLSNSGPEVDAGPGCRFADFDDDTDVDLTDYAAFGSVFTVIR